MSEKHRYCDLQPEPSEESGNFQVDLGGILSILSDSIYSSGAEVFIREQIQNGQDALSARRQIEPGFGGTMSIEAVEDADGSLTVIVEDDGIGLTQEEATRAFSTIAFSTKKQEGSNDDDSPFVGRFGIGLLSGFLVADEINIFSRRAGSGEPPVHWVGKINGTLSSRPASIDMPPGTRVYLRLRAEAAREFSGKAIFDIAQKYGRYLPHPITFRSAGHSALVNDEAPLWDRPMELHSQLEAGREIFEEAFLSSFVFDSEASGSRGIAFIKAESCHAGAEAAHVVFIKNMLVSERALDIEPAGAPFLAIMLNSDRLRPNAGRDAVMTNDQRLPALRRDIESALLAHLEHLDREDRSRLEAIVISQYRSLAKLVHTNRAYLRFLIDYLPMDTTLGEMTLGEVFRRYSPVVEYVTDGTDFLRLQGKARSEGDAIVRVETDAAHRLIELLGQASEGSKTRRVTSSEYLGRFANVSKSPSQREQAVLNELAVVLRKENCTGNFFEGDDVEEIARLELNTLESIQRFLQIRESGDTGSKILLLNRLHPIVSQMIDGAAGQNHLHAWLRVLYHLALLQAREVPTLGETRRFSHSLGNIFTTSTLNSL